MAQEKVSPPHQEPSNEQKNGKSPLAVLRNLAHLNKLDLQFDAAKEEGPQHAKTYSINLNLGGKTWQGNGKSVRMAQVDAASKALKESKFTKQTKSNKKKIANPLSLTPTVKLNGLAMARGETVKYEVISRIPLPCQPIYRNVAETNPYNPPFNLHSFDIFKLLGNSHIRNTNKPIQRWIYPHLFRIQVTVGDRSFMGEGKTQQVARHDAAQRALEALQSIPIPEKAKDTQHNKGLNNKDKSVNFPGDVAGNMNEGEEAQAENKSSISLLYEKASHYKLKVEFTVTGEEGPPHLKFFRMKVSVANAKPTPSESINVSAEGVGPNKKTAKAKAASAVLTKLVALPLQATPSISQVVSHRSQLLTKTKQSPPAPLHPVSRLSQLMQAKHQKDPTYVLVSETKVGRREVKFITRCEAMGDSALGEGPNKRESKRLAAENLLINLGYSIPNKADSSPKKSTNEPRSKFKINLLPPLPENTQEQDDS